MKFSLPLLPVLFFFSLNLSYSQDINIQDTIRTEYYLSYSDYMNVRAFLSSRRLTFNLTGTNSESPTLIYAPNNRGYAGFGAFLFDLGVEFGFKFPKIFERNITKYGESEFVDIQSHIYGKKLNFDLTFQKYEGFYISNPWVVSPDLDLENGYPQRGDMNATHIFSNVIYLFNTDKFSYRAAYNQTEKQLKTAGSILLLSSLSYFRLQGDSVILYEGKESLFPNTASLVDGRFYTLSFLPGYSQNIVWKNFLFNLTASAGYGLQRQVYTLEKGKGKNWQLEPKLNVRAAITYDNKQYFLGTYLILHQTKFNVEGLKVFNSVYNFRVFAGYRFKKFGIFKKYSINNLLEPIKEKFSSKKREE